jgi:hypothetical protein
VRRAVVISIAASPAGVRRLASVAVSETADISPEEMLEITAGAAFG